MTGHGRGWRRWLLPPLLSPLGFAVAAVILAAAFGVVHVLGWRANTTILSGTSPTGDVTDVGPIVAGLLYVLLYFIFVVLVPILAMAAIVHTLMLRLVRVRRSEARRASASAGSE